MYQSGGSNATTLTYRNEPEQTSSFEYENFKDNRVFLNERKYEGQGVEILPGKSYFAHPQPPICTNNFTLYENRNITEPPKLYTQQTGTNYENITEKRVNNENNRGYIDRDHDAEILTGKSYFSNPQKPACTNNFTFAENRNISEQPMLYASPREQKYEKLAEKTHTRQTIYSNNFPPAKTVKIPEFKTEKRKVLVTVNVKDLEGRKGHSKEEKSRAKQYVYEQPFINKQNINYDRNRYRIPALPERIDYSNVNYQVPLIPFDRNLCNDNSCRTAPAPIPIQPEYNRRQKIPVIDTQYRNYQAAPIQSIPIQVDNNLGCYRNRGQYPAPILQIDNNLPYGNYYQNRAQIPVQEKSNLNCYQKYYQSRNYQAPIQINGNLDYGKYYQNGPVPTSCPIGNFCPNRPSTVPIQTNRQYQIDCNVGYNSNSNNQFRIPAQPYDCRNYAQRPQDVVNNQYFNHMPAPIQHIPSNPIDCNLGYENRPNKYNMVPIQIDSCSSPYGNYYQNRAPMHIPLQNDPNFNNNQRYNQNGNYQAPDITYGNFLKNPFSTVPIPPYQSDPNLGYNDYCQNRILPDPVQFNNNLINNNQNPCNPDYLNFGQYNYVQDRQNMHQQQNNGYFLCEICRQGYYYDCDKCQKAYNSDLKN